MTHAIVLRLYIACLTTSVVGAALSAIGPSSRDDGQSTKPHRGADRAQLHAKQLCVIAAVPGAAWSAECLIRIALVGEYPNYSFLAPLWAIAMLYGGALLLVSAREFSVFRQPPLMAVARALCFVGWLLGTVIAAVSFVEI